LGDILPNGGQLCKTRKSTVAVEAMGKLVDVRSKLAEMPQQPRQLGPLNGRPTHRARARATDSQGAQIRADAEPGFCRVFLDRRVTLNGAANSDEAPFRVRNASAASPRGRMFRS